MYVTTFYSFKGGVGRSMALANAAVELAKRGRRVLAVDFDLEAPGLDTFDILHPQGEAPGIIEFVHSYLGSNRAPDVREFVSRLPAVGDQEGELWIMPSGAQGAGYAAHFNDIDWAELYENRDGYLLFEDLKAQWEQAIGPDYVLIDSRTGHTDTGGICTRQLPDAVAILFFPNEQNLRGLRKVVKDIRAEAAEPRGKEIDLHFVMSNVPDLDDEDRILQGKIDAFRKELCFKGEPAVVHRYESLSLLNQVVFAKDRPGSRLAKEYRDIVDRIIARNLADRNGALDYIKTAGERWRSRGGADESPDTLERNLKDIEKAHAGDGKVLFALGAFMEDDRQQDRAASLFHRAMEAGYGDPEMYVRLARFRSGNGDRNGAGDDAMRALQVDDPALPLPLVREAVQLVASDRAKEIAASKAVSSLDIGNRIWLAGGLTRSPHEVEVAAGILEPVVEGPDFHLEESDWEAARSELAVKYIGMGACDAAAQLLGLEGRDVGDMDVRDAFNYAMAAWGATGEVVAAPFSRVVELDQSDFDRGGRDPDAHYYQCMAIAYWAINDASMAIDFVELAREAVTREIWSGSMFSCWRYYEPSASEFLQDLKEIEALINGDTSRKPRFMIPGTEAPPSSE